MTVILNASTSQGLVLTSDTSGNVVIQSNGANAITTAGSNVTIAGTLTTTGGVVQGANAAPAFSALLGTNQTITGGAWTKVQANTEEFDTNGNYDSSTNYRFTPTVAGYYQFNASGIFTSGSAVGWVAFYKNGAVNKAAPFYMSTGQGAACSALIYCNGSTDYVEYYLFSNATVTAQGNANVSGIPCYFQGFLARSA